MRDNKRIDMRMWLLLAGAVAAIDCPDTPRTCNLVNEGHQGDCKVYASSCASDPCHLIDCPFEVQEEEDCFVW